jgi:hypothetical protein
LPSINSSSPSHGRPTAIDSSQKPSTSNTAAVDAEGAGDEALALAGAGGSLFEQALSKSTTRPTVVFTGTEDSARPRYTAAWSS